MKRRPSHPDDQSDDVVTGRFVRNAAGYGFVRCEPEAATDVFINPRNAVGLMHGDRLLVRVLRVDARGRREGTPLRVLDPAPRRITGVIEIRGRDARVLPFEERVARFIALEPGRTLRAADRMAVGVEITHPPDEDGVARGKLVEVLGYPEEPGRDIDIIIRKHDLRHTWPAEVLEEVDAIPAGIPAAALAGRVDFTTVPTVTIDGETAKDFDDAVGIERLAGGTWRLSVHIADVAWYVPAGGATDREALARGTSVYFPGRAVPMLPEKLSNDLCSLRPGEPRLVQSAILDLDADGMLTSARFLDGLICSRERMTYTQVAGILVERDPALLDRYAPLVGEFEAMATLAHRLQARRRERGSIDFDLPEPEIVLNARGEMTGVFPSPRTIAHRIIEEFMLAANEAVASHLLDRGVPTLYRVHERPDPRRLETFDQVLQGLGYRMPRPLEAVEPRHLQAILDLATGKPEERFVSQLVLRALMQARYDPKNLGHFGLAAPRYTHFTSPIRRYPDLVVHRVLRADRDGSLRAAADATEALRRALPSVAEQSSRTERIAEEAERELEEWKKMVFMADRVGEEMHGFISGVMPFGLFIQVEEYFVEGLVPISSLGERCQFEERLHLLRGERTGRLFRLGDRVQVRVVRVDHFLRRMELEMVGEAQRPAGGRAGSRPGGKAKAKPHRRRGGGAARGARVVRRGRKGKR
jgi:ribonuclease R